MNEGMLRSHEELVSVVIPAFNAAETIAATLASVLQQTHRRLEVIVVDDGSADETPEIVASIAALDPRVRLISKCNAGVGSARNTGIDSSTGPLIAFVDADDLWHPLKIELQYKVLAAAGGDYGFVYSPCRILDATDQVLFTEAPYLVDGFCPLQALYHNFVRNGSSWLCRRMAVLDVKGFETALFHRGAQGCEDLIFTLKIAQRWRIAACPGFLVGYRRGPNQMSGDAIRMTQSLMIAIEILKDGVTVPVPSFLWRWSSAYMRFGMACSGLLFTRHRLLYCVEVARAVLIDPLGFVDFTLEKSPWVWRLTRRKWLRRLGLDKPASVENTRLGKRYYEMHWDEGPTLRLSLIRAARLRRLAQLDNALQPPTKVGELTSDVNCRSLR